MWEAKNGKIAGRPRLRKRMGVLACEPVIPATAGSINKEDHGLKNNQSKKG
jgi:hypothetical protein